MTDGHVCNCHKLYYGIIYNSISALSLLEDNSIEIILSFWYWCRGQNFAASMKSLECLRLNIPAAGPTRKILMHCLKNVFAVLQKLKQIFFILAGLAKGNINE